MLTNSPVTPTKLLTKTTYATQRLLNEQQDLTECDTNVTERDAGVSVFQEVQPEIQHIVTELLKQLDLKDHKRTGRLDRDRRYHEAVQAADEALLKQVCRIDKLIN